MKSKRPAKPSSSRPERSDKKRSDKPAPKRYSKPDSEEKPTAKRRYTKSDDSKSDKSAPKRYSKSDSEGYKKSAPKRYTKPEGESRYSSRRERPESKGPERKRSGKPDAGDSPKRYTKPERESQYSPKRKSRAKDSERSSPKRYSKSDADDSPKRYTKPEREPKYSPKREKPGSKDTERSTPKRYTKSDTGDSPKRYEKSDSKRPVKSTGRAKKTEEKVVAKEVRLNRYISNAGICSRREADTLITAGKIKVNGAIITEMGHKVFPTDKVEYQGKILQSEKLQYVLLNKPTDFITTTSDPHDRHTVMALVEKACEERIYPVGRLDRNTTGLLLFTNDGDLAKKLTHPSYRIKKIYQVTLDKPITNQDFDDILKGVKLEDGIATPDEMAIVSDDRMILGIEIHIGKNRIVRRLFEHFGYKVVKLDRVMFGTLTKKNLGRGKYRHLSPREVVQLKNLSGK